MASSGLCEQDSEQNISNPRQEVARYIAQGSTPFPAKRQR